MTSSTYLSRNECPRGSRTPNALLPQAPLGGTPSPSLHYCPEFKKKKKGKKKKKHFPISRRERKCLPRSLPALRPLLHHWAVPPGSSPRAGLLGPAEIKMELVKENVKKKKPKIIGKFVPGSINHCSRLATSQHTAGAAARRPAHSHFDPLSQLVLDWDPKDPLCTWALGGWALSPRPACPLSCPRSFWSRLAPGMYCVCWLCACWRGGPQPSVAWDSQPDPPPGQWHNHCQQRRPETIFIRGVFKDLCSCDFLFFFSVVFFERLS